MVSSLNDSVDVLEPVDGGEEFVIKHIGRLNMNFTQAYNTQEIVGRYYGAIFPLFKDTLYPLFRMAYLENEVVTLLINVYHQGRFKATITSKIFYENEELMILSDVDQKSVSSEFEDYQYLFDDTAELDHYAGINSNNYLVSYNVEEQEYSWSKKMYDLLEIEEAPGDYKDNILRDFILPEDLAYMRKKYKEITPYTPEVEYNFRIRTSSGDIKYINCNAFAVYDKNNYLQKIFYFFKDITTDNIDSQNLEVLKGNLYILQKLSQSTFYYKNALGHYNWTSNIANILESEDYESSNDKDIIEQLVMDDDKELFKNFVKSLSSDNPSVNFKIRILSKKGNIKHLNLFLRNNYDEYGNLMSYNMFVYDITDLENIQGDKNSLLNAFNSIDSNLKTGIIYEDAKGNLKVSNMFKDIIGVYRNWQLGGREQFINNIINKHHYLRRYNSFLRKETDEIHFLIYYKFNNYDDDIRIFEYFLKRNNGSVSGYIRDITDVKDKEMELKKLNNQKSMLIKEIHHRVKNNLQVLNSLLNLEERFYRNKPDQIIDATRKRISAMALIHELTYNSHNLETVNLKKYFDVYDENMYTIFHDDEIIMDNDIDKDINFHIRMVTPLVLIINEFTSNSIKYAFNYEDEEKENVISKKIRIKDDVCIVEYRDNGVGLPEGYDIHNSDGLGWTIINSLVRQLNGELEEIESEGIGFRLTFPMGYDELKLEEKV